MRILASQPVSIAKILDASFKLYSASFSKILPFCAALALFYIVIGILTQIYLAHQPSVPADVSGFFITQMLFAALIVLVFSVLTLVLYLALVYRVDNVVAEREDSFLASLQLGFKKFRSMTWALILYTLALFVGFLLLIIPGVIVGLSLAFYIYFIVLEDKGGYSALKASHALVWGHWWRTLTIFMAPGIVLWVIYFGIFLMIMVIAPSGFNNGLEHVVSLLVNLISAFTTPYFFILGYVQFHDLKLRKTGADLAKRLGD